MKAETLSALPVVVLSEAQLLMVRGGTGGIVVSKTDNECQNLNCSKCQNCECSYVSKCLDCGVDVKIVNCGAKSIEVCATKPSTKCGK